VHLVNLIITVVLLFWSLPDGGVMFGGGIAYFIFQVWLFYIKEVKGEESVFVENLVLASFSNLNSLLGLGAQLAFRGYGPHTTADTEEERTWEQIQIIIILGAKVFNDLHLAWQYRDIRCGHRRPMSAEWTCRRTVLMLYNAALCCPVLVMSFVVFGWTGEDGVQGGIIVAVSQLLLLPRYCKEPWDMVIEQFSEFLAVSFSFGVAWAYRGAGDHARLSVIEKDFELACICLPMIQIVTNDLVDACEALFETTPKEPASDNAGSQQYGRSQGEA